MISCIFKSREQGRRAFGNYRSCQWTESVRYTINVTLQNAFDKCILYWKFSASFWYDGTAQWLKRAGRRIKWVIFALLRLTLYHSILILVWLILCYAAYAAEWSLFHGRNRRNGYALD
jgi:hypothetical protein